MELPKSYLSALQRSSALLETYKAPMHPQQEPVSPHRMTTCSYKFASVIETDEIQGMKWHLCTLTSLLDHFFHQFPDKLFLPDYDK